MRAACIVTRFGLENLTTCERPLPVPAEHQVLLRIRAASLNYRDLLVARGEYNSAYPLPLILGSDAVGEVVALGPKVDEDAVRIGDRVCPLFAQGWLEGAPRRDTTRHTLGGPLPGVFADYAIANSDSVVKVPDALSDLDAACLPCAALTAWSALVTLSAVEPGQIVLTLGSGGVSVFAIQIARWAGARVIASSRDAEKRARLLELGAEAVVDSTQPKWGERVRKLTGCEGVDHVIEVGGAATLGESLRAVRPGGTISLIGTLGGAPTAESLMPVVMRNLRLQGVFVGHRRSFEQLLAACAGGAIRAVIDSVHPLEQTQRAFERLQSGRHFGKVCLALDAGSAA